jgi:hypothetical protein
MKHHRNWTVEHRPDGIIIWTFPTGRQYTTRPEPILVLTSHNPPINHPTAGEQAQQNEDELTDDDTDAAPTAAPPDDDPPF